MSIVSSDILIMIFLVMIMTIIILNIVIPKLISKYKIEETYDETMLIFSCCNNSLSCDDKEWKYRQLAYCPFCGEKIPKQGGVTTNEITREEASIIDKIKEEIIHTGAYEQEAQGNTQFLAGINYCLYVINKYRS